eukprot:CAMPEP_0171208072 /NCGR_PEP_ID=MMETSP0790-20130122/27902_1 /TAXON_ID=2925 /ORGANISM="Alexandrium catenella, Strain OF101" /LENGTH=72 /DNA_ID=CAMNT_0011673661 /DNA_START=157 /DNA_END=372 /DNA_ORIENTATION=-
MAKTQTGDRLLGAPAKVNKTCPMGLYGSGALTVNSEMYSASKTEHARTAAPASQSLRCRPAPRGASSEGTRR